MILECAIPLITPGQLIYAPINNPSLSLNLFLISSIIHTLQNAKQSNYGAWQKGSID